MKDGITDLEKKFLPMRNMKIFKLLKNLLTENTYHKEHNLESKAR